jgi:hypothetical protein
MQHAQGHRAARQYRSRAAAPSFTGRTAARRTALVAHRPRYVADLEQADLAEVDVANEWLTNG